MIPNDVDTASARILESSDNNEVETSQKIPFSCELYEFVGESIFALDIHRNRKHKTIPQLDGDNSEC